MRLLHHAAAALLLLLAGRACAQFGDLAVMDDDLAPRYWHPAAAVPPALARRAGGCGADEHPCSDINSTLCCPNDRYCVVNSTTWQAQCCDLSLTCGGPCGKDTYLVNATRTGTTSGTTTVATVSACQARRCKSTHYACASTLGGNCCAFTQDCGLDATGGGICLATSSSSSTSSTLTTTPTLVTPLASGCTAQGQVRCSGGGCCGAGYACAVVSSSAACTASTAAAPTGSGITVEHSGGLSAGAKAGVAVGVIGFAAAVIGAITWFCLRRRRSSGRGSTATGQEMPSVRRGGESELASDGGIRPYGPSSGPHMSEADGTSYGYPASSIGASRAGGGPGGYQDYFGPGVAGPRPEMGAGIVGAGAAGGGVAGGGVVHEQRAVSPEYLAQTGGGGGGGVPRSPGAVAELGAKDSAGSGPTHAGMPLGMSEVAHNELADTSAGIPRDPPRAVNLPPASPVDRTAEPFELQGSPAAQAQASASEVFHDAPEGASAAPSAVGQEQERHTHREV